ncbi:MAG: beta strand repeat-containing protein, partial [Niastella sp.]|uniref:beta strand repeat-containing protein n=1 Tax=Niastella sp. TaxID=1869183 RepID=UPI00389A99E2
GGVSYSWSGPNGFSSTQQNPVIANVTASAGGAYTVSVTNAAGCSASTTINVTVNGAVSAGASSNSPVCTGNTLNLLASGGVSYVWNGPNGFSSTQQNPVIANTTGAASGTYTVTVTTATGCIATTTTDVTVNAAPAANASSNTPVCTGGALNLFASGGVSYSWSGPNGFSSQQPNPTISTATAANGGTYTVTVTNAAGCSATTTTSVTVNTTVVPTASSNTPVCTGSTLTLFAGGGVSYSWTGPNSFTSTQQNPTITGTTAAASGTYTVTVTGAGGCTANTTTTATVSAGSIGGSVNGSTAVCSGSNNGTCNLSGETGSVIRWESSTDGGTNWTPISNTTTSLTYTNLTQATQFRAVVQVGSCNPANSTAATITMNAASVGGTVSGSTGVCSGSNSGSVTLSGQTGSVIRWESSTDNGTNWSTINNTTTTLSYTNLTQTTQYHAVVQSGSCTSAISAPATITVNVSAAGGTVSGSTSVCTGINSGTLSLSGYAGTIIKWQLSTNSGGSWTDIANTTTSQSYSNLTQSTLYRAVIGGCSTTNSSIATITVTPTSVGGTVSGSTTACSGSNGGTLTLSGQTGSVIRWESSIDNGTNWTTISNTNTTQTYTNLTQTTQYRAVVLSGVCTPANSSVATITINGAPAGGTISGSTMVCGGSNNGTLTLSGYSGSIVKWQSSVNSGSTWTDIANTTTTQSYSNLTQTTQYRAVISGCATTVNSGIATITMGSGGPTVTITASDATNDFCNGVTLTANSSAPVQSYLWSTNATTQTVKLGTANAAGNYSVVVTSTSGCTGSATYNYDPQAVSSSYSILGTSSVDLARNNNVQSGSIGVTGTTGSITIAQTTSVASPGAFVKAKNLNINASANVPIRYNTPAAVTLPTMQYNTTSTSSLSNITVQDNSTGTLNGNYRSVTIGANCNITLSGNIFGLITIKASSKVRFTQAVVNVAGVNFKAGTAAAPTTLAFSQNTTVRSTGDFNLNPGCAINPEGYK